VEDAAGGVGDGDLVGARPSTAEETSRVMASISPVELSGRADEHGGRRRLLVVGEQLVLGEDEADGRAVDGVHRPEGAGELALDGALQVDALAQVGGPERLVVEQLVARHGRRRGDPGLGEVGADGVEPVLRDHDPGAVELVGDAEGVELTEHGRELGVGDAGVQDAVARGHHPADEGHGGHDQHGHADDDADPLGGGQRPDEGGESVLELHGRISGRSVLRRCGGCGVVRGTRWVRPGGA
jgi:hypothetical protein